MLIDGPFSIRLMENTETLEREIHIDFRTDFQELEKEQQAAILSDYIRQLNGQLQTLDQQSQEYQGMMTIVQFTESIYPHIAEGEIPLEETIVIEIEQGSPLSALIGSGSLH